jgi:hypothetical protein
MWKRGRKSSSLMVLSKRPGHNDGSFFVPEKIEKIEKNIYNAI